jgi:prepilin-type N-terminal cleavage/methylation domain-containing protein
MISVRHIPRRQRGFTLVEILVVLIIGSILITMAALFVRAISGGQKRSLTATRLAVVDAALTQYVVLQKRLPCPANGRLLSTDADSGKEIRDNAAQTCLNVQHGVVPWRTLGISDADGTDGWDRRFTYRVDEALTKDAPPGMDMSLCDPASSGSSTTPAPSCTACTAATLNLCTPPRGFLIGKGLEVRTMSGTGTKIMDPAPTLATAPPTGAAYVLISHGETGGGAYLGSGSVQESLTTDGTEEQRNYATNAMPAGWYFVDDGISDIAGLTTHFDDMLSRPSIMTVVNRAGLGPRSHN